LKAGDDGEATRRLWERYFAQLARLAYARLRAAPRGPTDGEDVALSAFDSFFRGAAAGRFVRLEDRDDLWKILTTIASRKAANQRRKEYRLKRGGGRVAAGPEIVDDESGDGDPLARIVSREPTPEFAAAVTDELRCLFELLADDSLRSVARLRMEGYTNEQIAAALDISLRSVERKLALIRKAWNREGRS
jgi:DNA-directed RNA polymerase specialized sigma24 family protein